MYNNRTYKQGGLPVEIVIKRLGPELIEDYFDFFDNRAFTDNPPWPGCYCTGFQTTKEEQDAEFEKIDAYGGGDEGLVRVLRETVVRQITTGALRGYLAYADGVSIAWCNANDRASFPETSANGASVYAPAGRRERAVLCFEIAPECRGKGVATALLDRAIADAREEGCAAVVAFPQSHEAWDTWDFPGPVRLYEKAGFVRATEPDGRAVMRKAL